MQKRYGWWCTDLRRNARNRIGPAPAGSRVPQHGPPAPNDPAEPRAGRDRPGAVPDRAAGPGSAGNTGSARDGAVPGDRRPYGLARYTAGAVAARTGDEMSGPALLLAGLATTGSAVTASTLLAAVTVAAAAGGPLLGALLDRSARPGRLLAGALAGYALALLVILLCLGRVPIGPTLAVAVLAGLLGPAVAGGWTSRLPGIVPADRLDRANTLDAMTFNAAGLLGPLIAGGAALYAGAGTAVVVSAALVAAAVPAALHLTGPRPRTLPSVSPHISASAAASTSASASAAASTSASASAAASASTSASVKASVPPAPSGPPPAPAREAGSAAPPDASAERRGGPAGQETLPRPSVRTELAAGFRAIGETGPLSRATASSVLSCAGQGAFVVCAPFLGAQVLGDAGHGTLLLAVVAASALAANALSARRRTPPPPEEVLAASTALLAAALALMATYHPLAVVAGAVLLGAGEGPQLTALFAIRHREAPERLRAQIFTTGASLKITGFAVGAAAAGPLAARSPAIALTATAIVQLLAVLPLSGRGRRQEGRMGRRDRGTTPVTDTPPGRPPCSTPTISPTPDGPRSASPETGN
ncbi:MFS transporter [Streptomyces sp. NPDC094448]|uniref:MFS transporter n=1 Tax=Streptomyces sp. NPDC094448 TaxID=3366063 RepID=UPI003830E965